MDDEENLGARYLAKAETVRAKAAMMQDRKLREMMLQIAVDYEEMAKAVQHVNKGRRK